MFPLFSPMVSEKWDGLSVGNVCPLKALLNNLHQRLSHYAGFLGRTCEVWHGDISTSRTTSGTRLPTFCSLHPNRSKACSSR